MKPVHWLTANELAAAYRDGSLSPVDVVKALLSRIEKCDKQVNAFIHVDAEGALAAAECAEKEIRRGHVRGQLHGVPVGFKDNIDVAGIVTSCHSNIMLDNVAKRDALVVAQLRAAGCIVLGKQSLHEFAFGGPSPELPFPHAKHPWNTEYHPGGSSSGSGAALAAGLVPISIGTDAGGSIRNPAGSCGVVGLKPTYDLISRDGVFPVSPSNDHVGPMARSVGDIQAIMDELRRFSCGPDSSRLLSSGERRSIDTNISGLRIGFVRQFHEKDMVASQEVVAALEEVARVLTLAGAKVKDITLPRLQEYASVQRVILLSEAWPVHERWLRERPQDYSTPTRRKVMGGAFLSASHLATAYAARPRLTFAVDDALRDVDILLTAAAMDPVCKIADQAELLRTYPRQARSPFNLTGHPALVMMSGLSKNGLPLSVQFVAKKHDEDTLFRVARYYEHVTGWQEGNPKPFDS